ncbi:MAG TPA: hypothetical protein VGC57_12260 [Cellulomonas sp.]
MQPNEPEPSGNPIEQARRHAEVVRHHVEDALALAEEQGGPFDFLSVAIAAHCSVAYLRQHREFATRIRALQATVPQASAEERDHALRDRLARSEQQVQMLRGEVERLAAENTRLRSRLTLRPVPLGAARPATGTAAGPGAGPGAGMATGRTGAAPRP